MEWGAEDRRCVPGRVLRWTSAPDRSGSSGIPGESTILVDDRFSRLVVNLVVRVRERRTLVRAVELRAFLRHGVRAAALVQELNDLQPTVLYGYPGAMLQLAAEQQSGRLRIRPVLAISSGENLSATGHATTEAAFGCRVTERYLSLEVPALTSQCRRGAFHVNSDWYILEPVDTDYQPVPPRTDRSGKFRQVWSA